MLSSECRRIAQLPHFHGQRASKTVYDQPDISKKSVHDAYQHGVAYVENMAHQREPLARSDTTSIRPVIYATLVLWNHKLIVE